MSEVHGRRLLPSTIDSIAHSTPDHAWASMQSTSSSEFQDVSIAVFANAVNRIAHWIVEKLGRGPQVGKPPVLAYIGASDLRYYVLCMAIAKAGYVPLFISHMNSAAANASLFDAVDCKVLLCGLEPIDAINVDTKNVNVVSLPSPHQTWEPTPVPAFPFTKTYDEAVDEPILIMHTSGSTGMPKPITITHGWFTVTDSSQDIPDFEGHKSEPRMRAQRSRHFLGFPPFHPAGLSSGLRDSIYFGNTIVFPRADRPIDAACVIDAINHGNVDGAALLPHVLEEMARNEEAVEKIGRLGYIDWVGGPITQEAGDIISSRTTLNNAYASTEIGASTQLLKEDRTLWNWYFFHPKSNGFDFRPVLGEDGLHELFVVRQPTLEQPVFRIFPELNEWPTKDLFVAHPTLPHHWRLTGRSDDLIVFQNGSKIHPSAVQTAIQSAPGVKHSIMFGSGRVRPGLLIEPKDSSLLDEDNAAAGKRFLDDVYLYVQQNNQRVPSNGVVIRSLVALITKEKPLPMTGKGTLQRKAALDLYQQEIDALYEALPQSEATVPDFRIGSGS